MAYPYDPRQQNPGYNPPAWANPQQQQWTNPQPNPTPPPQPQFYNAPLSRQLADCCCENRQGQADIKYAMATDTCAITNAINQAAQQIMQNDNANYRQLHDEQVAIQMQAKDAKIQEQASLINSLNLAQSQANQNQYLVNTLRPCPVPAYQVQNPWATSQYGGCCGSNSNCCNYG